MNSKIAAAIAAVGVVVAVVALVIGINAQNATTNDKQVQDEVRQQIGVAEKNGQTQFGRLDRVNRQQAKLNKGQSTRIKGLTNQVNSLLADQKAQDVKITNLQNQINTLNNKVTKIQKELNQIGG